LPFIATDDAIFNVMASWSPELHISNLEELEKITAQQQKRETKLHIAKLAERKCQEQEATTQWKAIEVAATVQMVETTTAPTEETEEGQEMSTE